jgi:hypothetical protein
LLAPTIGFRRVPLPADVIVVAVRWYLRYGLPYRDVADRGADVDHVSVLRRVQRFTPLLADSLGKDANPPILAAPLSAAATSTRTQEPMSSGSRSRGVGAR